MQKEINIFIISPSDVKPERQAVKEICEMLNNSFTFATVRPRLWEYHPLSYSKNPQEGINEVLEISDIFIVILWHRLGTVVKGCTGAISGSTQVTGTQYEIEKILSMGKESIYFYRKKVTPQFTHDDFDEAISQKKLLDRFLDQMDLQEGSTKHGYHSFVSLEEFREKVEAHLRVEIEKISGRKIEKGIAEEKARPISALWWGMLFLFPLLYLMQPSINAKNSILPAAVQKEAQEEVQSATNGESLDTQQNQTYSIRVEEQCDGNTSHQFDKRAKNFLVNLLTHAGYTVSIDPKAHAGRKFLAKLSFVHKKSDISGYIFYTVSCGMIYTVGDRDSSTVLQAGIVEDEGVGYDEVSASEACFVKLKKNIKNILKKGEGDG